jgi:diguanylate cyclase (GGDEF)-like protein/PAS domain S-box-containing protein
MEMREAHADDGMSALRRAEIELMACRDALRRLSEQLDRQRDHLESVLSVAADAAIAVDKQGLIGFVNPAAEALLGWNFSEAVGKPLSNLVSYVQDAPMPGANALDAVRAASGGAATATVAFRDHLGREVVLQCRLTSLLDENDQFTGAVLTLNDGSHRQFESLPRGQDSLTHADALFEEKERAQVTLNSIGDAVISTDFRGRVSYLNIVAEQMTGWTQEEASGRALDDVFPLVDVTTGEPIPNPTVRAIIENTTVGLGTDCVLVQRNGGRIAVEDSAAPIHDRHGAVIGAVMVAHDVTAARELSQKLARLALHDNLTDVPNRALLNDRLAQAIERARRSGHSVALLYVDLDRFKHINDSLGHAVGDQVLQSAALRLLECVRSSDTVSRHGGDEFIVLLAEVMHAQDAAICADKMIRALDAPHRIGIHELRLTASIGIATFPEDAQDAEALIRNADVAMYQAKSNGRNSYQCFKHEMNVQAHTRQTVETDLRRAIERREFVLHYQPKVNLVTGAIAGVEALIRWQHPQQGLLTPNQFISIAEESGLIVAIGRWALEEVCRQARAWQDAGAALVSIAINVSAVELRSTTFFAGVRDIIQSHGLKPSFLEIELTETFMMQDWKSTAEVLRALTALGVRIALDDFGTGYSSLSYMKRFPIDTLKIDQSFVRDMATDPDDASIVSAVINMGRSLHMRVVAEGIETQEQLSLVQTHQCPEGQGHYFCAPVSAEQLTPYLLDHGTKPAFADKTDNRQRRLAFGPGR